MWTTQITSSISQSRRSGRTLALGPRIQIGCSTVSNCVVTHQVHSTLPFHSLKQKLPQIQWSSRNCDFSRGNLLPLDQGKHENSPLNPTKPSELLVDLGRGSQWQSQQCLQFLQQHWHVGWRDSQQIFLYSRLGSRPALMEFTADFSFSADLRIYDYDSLILTMQLDYI